MGGPASHAIRDAESSVFSAFGLDPTLQHLHLSEPPLYTGVDLRRWHTRVLTACLDRLGLDSAHLVGHSYGGMFGLWLALDAPQRVRSVVSIGPPFTDFGGRPDALFRMLALPALGPLVLAMPSPGPVYRRLLATSIGRHGVGSAPPDLLRATYLGTRRPGRP